MKKIFIYAAALAALASALVSCSKEEPENPNPPVDPINHFEAGQNVTLTGFTAQTKVSSGIEGNNLVFRWEENDQIKVTVNGSSSTFTLTSVDQETGKGTFTGKMPATGDTYTAQFPVETPDITSQDYYEGGLPHNMMLFTTPESLISEDFSMKNEKSFLLLNFTSEKGQSVGKIEFTALGTGNPDPIYTLNCITTEYPSGIKLSYPTAKQFFLVAPTGKYRLKVAVYDENDDIICNFETKKEMEFTTSQAISMPEKEVVKPTREIKFQRNGVNVTAETTTMAPATAYTIPDLTNIGTGDTVIYESSDPTKASFANENDPTITINAITDTDTPITIKATRTESASYQAASAEYKLTIKRQPQAIVLMRDGTQIDPNVGESFDMTKASSFTLPVAKDAENTQNDPHTSVTFESSNKDVADYVQGTFKIKKKGSTTITATAEQTDKYESATFAYTLSFGLAKQEISLTKGGQPMPATETVSIVDTYVLPTVSGAQTDVTHTSTKTDIAEFVTENKVLKLKLKKAGTTTIKFQAEASDIYEASNVVSYELTVTQPVTGITLKESTSLVHYATETLTPTVLPEDATNKNVEWSSSAPTVVSVTSAGVIEGLQLTNGTPVTITCTAKDGSGKYASCSVSVTPLPVTGITLNKSTDEITIGGTDKLSVASWTPSNADDKTHSWSVTGANPSGCVTVDTDGTVHAVKVGTATVVCTAKGGTNVTAPCAVTVKPILVSSITLNKTTTDILVNGNETLTKTVSPDNATDKSVTWSSANEGVAKVDANGKIEAIAIGSTTITCAANDASGVSATCTVNVLGYFEKISTMANLKNGYYIITNTDATKAFLGKDAQVSGYIATNGNTVDVTVTNNVILDNSSLTKCKVTIANTSGTNYSIRFNDLGKYFRPSSNYFGTFRGSSSEVYNNTISADDNNYQIKSDGYYVSYSSAFVPSSSISSISLWKYVGLNTSKDPQNLSFDTPSYSWALGTDHKVGSTYTTQTVKGALTTPVTYSSSDEEIATVNASTGEVTIKSAGTVTIIASAPESDKYWAGVASYTMEFTKSGRGVSYSTTPYNWYLGTANGYYNTSTTYNIVEPAGVLTVSGTKAVSYTVSGVASIQDGKIKLTGSTGTVTVTASVAEDANYLAGSASYTINVTKQTITGVSPSSVIFSASGAKYSTNSGSSWSDTPSGEVSASDGVSVSVSTNNNNENSWTIASSWTRTTPAKNGTNVTVPKPAAITNWPANKPSGTVTVTAHNNTSSTGTINVAQNRPLIVTGGLTTTTGSVSYNGLWTFSGSVTGSITFKTDASWTASVSDDDDLTNLSITSSKSGNPGENLTVSVKQSYTLWSKSSTHYPKGTLSISYEGITKSFLIQISHDSGTTVKMTISEK